MSNFKNKAVSVALSLTTVVWLSGATMLPVVNGATAADIQAQITQLQATIAALQAQLNTSTGGSSSSAYAFTRDLTVGKTGDDVKALQSFLISKGLLKVSAPTGYFGALTKSAVAAWQSANGVTPAAGYFGAKSRAAYAAMAGTGGTGGTGGTSGTGGATSTPPAAGNLAVSLNASQPSGSVIAGGGQTAAGRWDISGSGTITGLTFQKVGVVSDSNISNAYVADHVTGLIYGQYSSLSSGVLTFTGLSIPVSGVKTLALRVDLSTSASAGNTIGWQLTGVTAGSLTVSGVPSTGPTLTVTTVSNPSIATASFTFNSIGTTVNAGTTGVQVADLSASITNSPVYLKNIKFSETGSSNNSDLQNLVVKVGGVAVGNAVPVVAADGSVFFDLSSANVKLGTGSTDVALYADVMGSPNRTMQFTLLHTYDVNVVDSQYNAGVAPTVTTTNATTITINKGQITVNVNSGTPTGNIAAGVSSVTLAKFNIYASGEAVKVQFLDVKLVPNGTGWATTAAAGTDVTNLRIVDDAGGQVGTSISTLAEGAGTGACTYSTALSTDSSTKCHFGTSGSPINYIVPANTTRVLSVVADLASTVVATTIQATLPGNTSNLLGQISNQSASSGAANGAVRTVTSSSLTSAVNSALGTVIYAKGKTGAKVGSFVLSASSAQGVNVSSLTVTTSVLQSSTNIIALQNLLVKVGSTQFGTTQATIASSTAYTFSGSSISVPIGGSVTADVYADILGSSNADTYASAVSLTGWTASGQSSGSSISFDASRTGQSVSVSSGPTLTISADAGTSPAQQVVMGSTGNSVFSLRLAANNVEDVKVTALTLADVLTATTTNVNSFQNLYVYDSAAPTTPISGPLNLSLGSSVNSQTAAFSFASPVVVPQNGSKTLVFKGDVATFTSGGSDSGSTHTFRVFKAGVTALGNSSNVSATVSAVSAGVAAGNTQTVYRSKVSLAASTIGSASGRPRTSVDDLAKLTISADPAGDVKIDSISLTFAGTLLTQTSAASAQTTTVTLLDDSTASAPTGCATVSAGAVIGAPGACKYPIFQNATGLSTNSTTAVFSFGTPYVITAGTSKTFRVRLDSSAAFDTANVIENLTVTVNAAGDLTWEDQTNTGLSIQANVVPFIVASGLGY